MNTILTKHIQINSAAYLFSIIQDNLDTCYSLFNQKEGILYKGTVQNFPIKEEYANKMAHDLEKNQSFFELLKDKIVITYGFLTINLHKQQKQSVLEQNTSQTKFDPKLLNRLELLGERVNNIEKLELKVQKLNKRVHDLEGEIKTNSETYFQNMYSSERAKICNFVKKPTILTSLGGIDFHDSTMGSSSVYYATKDFFYVLVKQSNISPNKVKQWKWHLNWIAIGEVTEN
ncbi:hypothetical protein M0813_06583 [Anaeramoeba flamelloides]|uniref:Uncharacterized protein n=1 Tax=Anaeramoeba flamelloides TaxID=1746091 RepID=A0ABQ8XD63_9EUKA|nr:hypothetical protein M0813_06583 [Anaeramoeba flamelloides]